MGVVHPLLVSVVVALFDCVVQRHAGVGDSLGGFGDFGIGRRFHRILKRLFRLLEREFGGGYGGFRARRADAFGGV